MKSKLVLILILCIGGLFTSCDRVDPGFVGVKVKTLGQNKGVEPEVLGTGRYWMGMYYDLYQYPTYMSIYSFTLDETEGSPVDEAFRFQSIEGITCNVDLAISAHADPILAAKLFTTYRKDMESIIKENLRQDVANYFIRYASNLRVDQLYSKEKMDMIAKAKEDLTAKVAPTGIVVDDISYKSDIRFPQEVSDAIIGKIKAVQEATKKENELASAEADAKKLAAAAQGEYEKTILEAKANEALSRSITPSLIQYELAKRWNGVSPIYSGNGAVLPPVFSTK